MTIEPTLPKDFTLADLRKYVNRENYEQFSGIIMSKEALDRYISCLLHPSERIAKNKIYFFCGLPIILKK